jgi:ribosomal protein L28
MGFLESWRKLRISASTLKHIYLEGGPQTAVEAQGAFFPFDFKTS